MITRVRRWGNSLALRIPKSFAREARIEASSQVDLSVKAGRLIATPLKRPRLTLGDLVGKVTKKNLHGELPTGGPVGREIG